uniref:Uncharacterized protein n=1 Tax=Arundo donax TaxID=35708 RepID=A0A0A8ZZ41_ARUDO
MQAYFSAYCSVNSAMVHILDDLSTIPCFLLLLWIQNISPFILGHKN